MLIIFEIKKKKKYLTNFHLKKKMCCELKV
jgi:hypothetical protein